MIEAAWIIAILIAVVIPIGIWVLIIIAICNYLAKQIAAENKKILQQYQADQMRLNGLLARQIAYELNNYDFPEEPTSTEHPTEEQEPRA